MELIMTSKAEITCPCGSGQYFNNCCFRRTELPEHIGKYELVNKLLLHVVEFGSNLLNHPDFSAFCNNSVDQLRLLLDCDQSEFEEILNSNIGCQLVMEWLLFLAPLSRSMDDLSNDLNLAETCSFIEYLLDSNDDVNTSAKSVIFDSDKVTISVSGDEFVNDLLRGLLLSRLTVLQRQDSRTKSLCVKDMITGDLHYLNDRDLSKSLSYSEVFVGRVVHTCNIKSILTVYGLPFGDKPRKDLLRSCEEWYSLVKSDTDFSDTDMQVNLLTFLAHCLV